MKSINYRLASLGIASMVLIAGISAFAALTHEFFGYGKETPIAIAVCALGVAFMVRQLQLIGTAFDVSISSKNKGEDFGLSSHCRLMRNFHYTHRVDGRFSMAVVLAVFVVQMLAANSLPGAVLAVLLLLVTLINDGLLTSYASKFPTEKAIITGNGWKLCDDGSYVFSSGGVDRARMGSSF